LLDDGFLLRFVPAQFVPKQSPAIVHHDPHYETDSSQIPFPDLHTGEESSTARPFRQTLTRYLNAIRLAVATIMLTWIAYDTTAELIGIPLRTIPFPTAPIAALEPFRIANQYGLFAVMTSGRYEIEFQGSNDGKEWIAYPFRYKPQALNEPPRVYAPYQPRFDWNLWFASLGDWRQNNIVPLTEERLLSNEPDVLALFKENPFQQNPPRYVRAVLWQYWFTSIDEKRHTGNWWRRQLLGLYAPEITSTSEGKFEIVQWPEELPPHN
jgi:hypothetical protein